MGKARRKAEMKTWKQRNPDKVKAQTYRRRVRRGRYGIYNASKAEQQALRESFEMGLWKRKGI